MFVSDPLFPATAIKIKIYNCEGGQWLLDVSPDVNIQNIKLMALGHFFNPVEAVQPKISSQYKLVLVSEGRSLSDDNTVIQESLKENDELLLFQFHVATVAEVVEEKDQSYKGPSEAAIMEHTACLPPCSTIPVVDDASPAVDFQTELRKILVSLVDASQKILRFNPEAWALVVGAPGVAPQSETPSRQDVDPVALRQLVDMGFPRDKVIEALKCNNIY